MPRYRDGRLGVIETVGNVGASFVFRVIRDVGEGNTVGQEQEDLVSAGFSTAVRLLKACQEDVTVGLSTSTGTRGLASVKGMFERPV